MRPFEHLTSPDGGESAEQVRHMVAYLTDHTSLISNPGLVSGSSSTPPSARTAVAVVERIGKFWRQRGQGGSSKYGKHIIRRYVTKYLLKNNGKISELGLQHIPSIYCDIYSFLLTYKSSQVIIRL